MDDTFIICSIDPEGCLSRWVYHPAEDGDTGDSVMDAHLHDLPGPGWYIVCSPRQRDIIGQAYTVGYRDDELAWVRSIAGCPQVVS